MALLAALAAGAAMAAARTPALSLTSLDRPGVSATLADLKGKARVILFWRADCAPCLVELADLGAYEAAAKGRLSVVALQPAGAARAELDRRGIHPASAWASADDAAGVLTAFGGAPPRLPLAVALDRKGRICAVHHGLLGTDRVKRWVRQCSG